MNPISRLFYHLTAYIPRKLPATPEAYERFFSILVNAYGIPDEPPIRILVAGQISSHDPHSLRMPWGHIANAAKKMRIMNLAAGHKHKALAELNVKLEAAVQKEVNRMKEEGNGELEESSAKLPQTDAGPQSAQA